MAKKSSNRVVMIFKIFWDGIVWYCKYLDTFLKYMFFPVFGQILGIFLIFLANYYFIVNISDLIKKYQLLDNLPLVFTLLIICVAPGFLVFGKAFFDYLVAFTSLNSMAYVSRGEKLKNKPLDTKTHDDLLKKRMGKYLILLCLFSLLFLIGVNILLIVPYIIVSVYFCLVFQVFMLEESVSPVGAFKRSFHLVKTNFGITVLLLALSYLLTYWFLPNLFIFAFEKSKLLPYLAMPIQNYLNVLPIKEVVTSALDSLTNSISFLPADITSQINTWQTANFNINDFINTEKIAQDLTRNVIALSVIAFLLPMRCSWFTMLYKIFDTEKTDELRKQDYKKEK
ncbi:MAG: hypothetical protein K6C94_08515 [Candidatus Gastranaerophilales bacterium]|nr:hypothetical protein [Candidatus Gastranaerophilales bacterium]